jgi:hypothetical protein
MGLTVEEALELPGLAGTTVAAGASGLGRVVRHMVVDNPADPLAAAGPDVLVVLMENGHTDAEKTMRAAGHIAELLEGRHLLQGLVAQQARAHHHFFEWRLIARTRDAGARRLTCERGCAHAEQACG